MKSKEELQDELVNLEKRLREIKKSRKISMQDFKDQKADVESSMDEVLKELSELGV
jgi:hypothetical protein